MSYSFQTLQVYCLPVVMHKVFYKELMPCMYAALIHSPAQDADQTKSEGSPLLGTEASRGAPLVSGVKNATLRYDLPTPAVAVRNLVSLTTLPAFAYYCRLFIQYIPACIV